MAQPCLGIDLGTTNCAMAWVDPDGHVEVIPNEEGARVTPSVVQVRADGTFLVGEDAKRESTVEVDSTAQLFKRDMGTPVGLTMRGRCFSPVDLSAEVLKKLRTDAERHLGRPVRHAVITVPAYFHDGARVATQEAGRRAGLEVLRIINEPTAAALAFAPTVAGERTLLVYDLGGGTFDITLVRQTPEDVVVLGTDGNHRLGGKDWDDRLIRWVGETFQERQGVDPNDDPASYQDLSLRCEDAKKALSNRDRVAISVNCDGRRERIEVTRALFEELTADLLHLTEMLIQELVEETRFPLARLDGVLLAGGSTRMPMCRDLIRRLTGREPVTTLNPDDCVAIGAALVGHACAQGRDPQARSDGAPALPPAPARRGAGLSIMPVFQDVICHSLGMVAVSPDGDRYVNSILVAKNHPVPCRETRPYNAPTRPEQDNAVEVYVTQGESDVPGNCSFVGRYVISGVPHQDCGSIVEIAYAYDASGVVTVTAVLRASGRPLAVRKEAVPEDMSWVSMSPRELARRAHKTIYLAVDLSGSMSGDPLRKAKAAMLEFVQQSDLTQASIGVMAFEDRIRMVQEACQDARRLTHAIEGLAIGGGTTAHPFDLALHAMGEDPGTRVLVVLTDGEWYNQSLAAEGARACHAAGIEIVAIGFGGADEAFLRKIATSDQGALFTSLDNLSGVFRNIAQVLVENRGGLALTASRQG